FILDPWWNPAVEQQAIDRTHRIGQKKNVFIYKFITKDSVEEKILALQNRKRVVAESLITTEESFVKSLTPDDIKELLA
ncbi:MAG TPA: DEAD/DEAH box helicase, partial [Sphingobacteriaceae bacterium]